MIILFHTTISKNKFIFFRLSGPYVGCTDGAIEYVDKVLDWAQKYDLTILIDIHGIKDSQNGFDNSGQSLGFEWTSVLNTEPKGLVTFEHWPIRTANWMVSLLCDPLHPQFNHE